MPKEVLYPREGAYTTWCLAEIQKRANRIEPAATGYRQAIALYEKAIFNFPTNAELKSQIVGSLNSLATVLKGQGKTNEANDAVHRAEIIANELPRK